MIAQPNQHYDGKLWRELLDERVPRQQAEQMELHLSQCAKCRAELEMVAGQQQWWNETVEILSESTVSATPKTKSTTSTISTTAAHPLDASVDWIRPLLEECSDDPSSLGRMDHYVVQGVIGQGGMGVVLRGIDSDLNRPVAIKVLSPHLAGVGAARARFMREAQAAAAIVHPSIVPIYSVVTSARLPYIVMPCINGGNLQQRIDREGPLELSEVLRIGLQVSEGLAAAHRHGVIHRDIKPANILVEEGNGRVLISDFGLARALDDASLTISGMIAGTPQYMSPEQARGESIDFRSDLYSLGSLLYALATGRPPFRADSPLAVLRKISETRPRPIHHINERIPPWFDSLVSQLMQNKAAQRIGSADEASQILRDALAHTRNPAIHSLPRAVSSRRTRVAAVVITSLLATSAFLAAGITWAEFAKRKLHERTIGHSPESLGITLPTQLTPSDAIPVDRASNITIPVALPMNGWFDSQITFELMSIQTTLDQLSMELGAEPSASEDMLESTTPTELDLETKEN